MKVKFISVDAQIQRQIFDFTAGNNLLLSSIFLHNALSKTLLFICTLSALKKKRKQQPGLQCILLTCTFDAGNMTLKSLIREAGFLAEGSSSTASCCYFLMQMVIFLLWASKTCSIACSPFHTSQLSGAAPQGLPAQQTPGVNVTA